MSPAATTAVPPALAAAVEAASREVAAAAALALRQPPPWAALLAGAGVVFLLFGARRRAPLALAGGAAIGLALARWIGAIAGGGGARVQGELLGLAAGAGAILCVAFPALFPVLAGALPGAAIGGLFPVAGRAWAGALVGAAVGGALGAVLREWVACVAAGGIGAAAIVGGALGLLGGRPVGAELAARPMVLVAAWGVLAVSGAAFHAGRAWPKPGKRTGGGRAPLEPPDAVGRPAGDARR